MKKRSFLIILITITLLSSILLSSILGVTKAEYFKKLSKALDFEAKPDLALQYYLYDSVVHADDTKTTDVNEALNYTPETGVYKDAKNILQTIVIGEKDTKTSSYWGTYKDGNGKTQNVKYYFGDSIVYQIKIPVDEAGYYTLDFTVDFLFGGTQEPNDLGTVKYGYNENGHNKYTYGHPEDAIFDESVFTQSYQWCMGCEVLNSDDGFTFGNNTPLNMANRISQTNERKKYNDERVYYADKGTHSVYQWKTLTPTRAETVKLSFKATAADVTKGYVIWAWDFTGIKGQHNYRISIKGLDINKVMNLDGTTDYRSSVDPYFMFPQTSFTNNQVYVDENQIEDAANNKKYRGSNVPGKTRYSDGRGTFITEATENSLGLRAESLFRSVTMDADGTHAVFTNRAAENQSNPVALQIPVKNIRYDTTYKVTFDFSIARQGNKDVANITMNNAGFETLFQGVETTPTSDTLGKNLYDYAAFEQIFPSITANTQFRSYLYATSDPGGYTNGFGITNENHTSRRSQIVYANKIWNNRTLQSGQKGDFSLTCYNDVTRYNMAQHNGFLKYPNYTTVNESGTVNDPFCTVVQDTTVTGSNDETLSMDATTGRNWFNAVQHIEQNGQQGINWITFYNTTFSFNIDKARNVEKLGEANASGFINNLYWIWQIDALEHAGWYNIRIDNVRIQEVVQFSSEIYENGVEIAGTKIGTDHIKYYGQNLENFNSGNGDPRIFSNYRGWNGTGQNCIPRGYDKNNFFSAGNIYAPVIDARKFSVAPDNDNDKDYEIKLSGWAVCDGGIDRYVYSADGGKTWHDMTFTGTNVMGDRNLKDKDGNIIEVVSGWTYAEYGVEQKLNQQTIYNNANSNFVTFDASDGANCNFDGYALCADLEPYKNQPDLDIIIAAVPATNTNLRCEILRIMNYHSSNYYASQIEAITSDIVSSKGNIEMTPDNKLLAITSGTNGNGAAGSWVTSGSSYYYNENNWYVDYYPTSGRGVMTHLNAISAPIRYDNIATMASDIPIKTTLTVKGYMVCYFGVYEYAYSVDGGKTWINITEGGECYNTGSKPDTTVIYKKDANGNYELDDNGNKKIDQSKELAAIKDEKQSSKYERLQFQWVTRSFANDENYFATNNKGKFDTEPLKIDLSAYEGQVVDIIVAAKPFRNGSRKEKNDIYLPITKIDNVAVYGNDGTFFTRLHRVILDQRITSDVPDWKEAEPLYTKVNEDYPNGSDLNYLDKWSHIKLKDEDEKFEISAYTIFEPNNVNALESRLYNNEVNEMQSGGRVTIDGFVFCKGGVLKYKYSLDGGKTWTVINDSGKDISSTATLDKNKTTMLTMAKMFDNSFTVDDGKKGDYCCYTDYANNGKLDPFGGANTTRDAYYEHALEFNLPALPAGAERNLLVVAESNRDKLIPVLHIKLKFKHSNGVSQYGYHRTVNTSELSNLEAGYISTENNWDFIPVPYTESERLGTNKSLNRFTIPVTEEGEHMLRFVHTIENGPSEDSMTGHRFFKDKADNRVELTDRTSAVTLTANKTHYLVGDTISVDFTCVSEKVSGAFGKVQVAIVSEDWLNSSNPGEQHGIYVHNYSLTSSNDTSATSNSMSWTYHIDDITRVATGANFITSNGGLPKVSQELKAGKYSIVLIHRDDSISNVLVSEGLREKYLLAQIPIYIHDPDEKVEFTVVHDNGPYTYFSDLSTQLTSADENVDLVYTLSDPFKNTDTRAINAVVNVTKEDVKRGYIVFESNYTGLWSINEHTKAECVEKWGNPHNTGVHSDDVCASWGYLENGNPNMGYFRKKKLGDTMYEHSTDIKHTGITYETSISFGYDALTKKPSQTLIDTFFATKDKGYGNNVLMSTATKAGNHSFSYDPILNPPIRKGGINYNGSNTFANASLSVPKTYFEVGEPITVDYNATGLTNNVWVYITSDQECKSGVYGDLFIKRALVNVGTTGIVKFTAADTYDIGIGSYANTIWKNKEDELNRLRTLPAGEYKIWFISGTDNFVPDAMFTPNWNTYIVTEPITIKVIDPAAPDLSMTYWTDRPYTGRTDSTTALTLNKVVYEQGEEIPFRISGGYAHSWVTVVRSDDFKGYVCDGINVSNSQFASYEDKSYIYCRYAQWGAASDYLSGNGYLKTIDCGAYLEPGQYKVVYLFGQCLQHAWQGKAFSSHSNQPQKIMAIIDITIVPKNTLQKYSASYVKNDGSVGNILLDGNEFENFGNLEKLENLTHTETTLNGSTFTVTTTPVKHNVTLEIPNDVNTSLKNNVAFNIQTVYGSYAPSATVDSGNTYKFNYSALANIEQDGRVHKSSFNGSSMSVPKTYYEYGEPIPVTYVSKNVTNSAWIGIANLDDEYILWYTVGNNASGVLDIRNQENTNYSQPGTNAVTQRTLPPGEYKIWFIKKDSPWWNYENTDDRYNNPYILGNAVTDPICIKVVDPNNPDYSLRYSAFIGSTETSVISPMDANIKLEKNVFKQGESINYKISGRSRYMCAFLANSDEQLLVDQGYIRYSYDYMKKNWSDDDEWYDVSMSTVGLAPGHYKFYYALENSYKELYESHGAIVAIIDITILPAEEVVDPPLKLDVTYTNTSNQVVTRTFDVPVNFLLNGNSDNYDITDEDGIIKGTVELTDVKTGTDVDFVFYYDSVYRPELTNVKTLIQRVT